MKGNEGRGTRAARPVSGCPLGAAREGDGDEEVDDVEGAFTRAAGIRVHLPPPPPPPWPSVTIAAPLVACDGGHGHRL